MKPFKTPHRLIARLTAFTVLLPALVSAADPGEIPTICYNQVDNGNLIVVAHVRAGFANAVLETRNDVGAGPWTAHVSGVLGGNEGMVFFYAPDPGQDGVYRIRVGNEATPPAATYSGAEHFSLVEGYATCDFEEFERNGHLLNRLAYGPNSHELDRLDSLGLDQWLQEQLNPASIDESDNDALNSRMAALFEQYQPGEDSALVIEGAPIRYFKGLNEPPSDWMNPGFDDAGWLSGTTGIGYGDDDDATVLDDMRYSYTTVYLRHTFGLDDLSGIDQLELRVDFDDGFVAYLNGVEVVRENAPDTVTYLSTANGNHEAGAAESFDITPHKALLQTGDNVLAVVGLNVSLSSSDFSMIPEVYARTLLPVPAVARIRGIDELQELVHVRGIYSRRQLQAVLGEFWENHFTTDYDKVEEYFEDLANSDGSGAMPVSQARAEAAHVEYTEHEFFYENALGNFGDLLLYSATSPAQLIYLDSVLNMKDQPNENYAREILELFAFGVDNGYTQTDIEQLAKCFTGWTVRKVNMDQMPAFPASAREPLTEPGVQVSDTELLAPGTGWKFFKGTAEPAPDGVGTPTLAWAQPAYNDSSWLAGGTPMGYGDIGYGSNAQYFETVLSDMRRTDSQDGYVSVYLRRAFTIDDPASIENLVLSVKVDDGFSAYLNGVEVGRTDNLDFTSVPRFDQTASGNASEPAEDIAISLANFQDLLLPAPQQNVLALQVHNVSRTSSDLGIAPRIVSRTVLPGSIENGDPNGVWVFRFNPEEHNTDPKFLFSGTPHALTIPGDRTGVEGVNDAIDVIDFMVGHPSTAEFISIKLVNRFVSDEITLSTYHSRTAPAPLLALVDNAIAAWNSTTPKGDIATVMGAIIDPVARVNFFWGDEAFKAKIKSPVEFINSTVRAIDADVETSFLPGVNDSIGMHLFTRDEPNGWSELGGDWMDTGSLLQRIDFARQVASNVLPRYQWDAQAMLDDAGVSTAGEIVEFFNQRLFQGGLSAAHKTVLINFATTNSAGQSTPLIPGNNDYLPRVRELVGLILSLPHWQYQ